MMLLLYIAKGSVPVQLKIKIDLGPENAASTSQPAPFDPVKIRNFLLALIVLSSFVCTMAYSMWPTGQADNSPLAENSTGTLGILPIIMEDDEPPKQPKIIEQEQPMPLEGEGDAQPSDDLPIETTEPEDEAMPAKKAAQRLVTEVTKAALTENTSAANEQTKAQAPELTPHTLANDTRSESNHAVKVSHVPRAQLTSAIAQREPIDNLSSLSLDEQKQLFYFTQINEMKDKVIYHRWSLNGKVMAQVSLSIGGNKWRTYSSKTFNRSMVGHWQVAVVDDQNQVLKVTEFDVTQ